MSRQEFLNSICQYYQIEDLRQIQKAYWFSKNVHRPQQRNDGERYFEHPLRVAKSLIALGYTNVDIVVTALLHDVVEDTFTPAHVIVDLFGPEVWSNLNLLSKTRPVLEPVTLEMIGELKTEKSVYFEAITKANKAVRLVKVSDRVDNTRDLLQFNPDRQARYIEESAQYIIPIAKRTDPDLLSMLRDNLRKCYNSQAYLDNEERINK